MVATMYNNENDSDFGGTHIYFCGGGSCNGGSTIATHSRHWVLVVYHPGIFGFLFVPQIEYLFICLLHLFLFPFLHSFLRWPSKMPLLIYIKCLDLFHLYVSTVYDRMSNCGYLLPFLLWKSNGLLQEINIHSNIHASFSFFSLLISTLEPALALALRFPHLEHCKLRRMLEAAFDM